MTRDEIEYHSSPDWRKHLKDRWWNEFRITTPTSAYDVLERVIKLIEEEPARMNMETWGDAFMPTALKMRNDLPQCGTVACVSGWASIVTRGELGMSGAAMSGLLVGNPSLYYEIFTNDYLIRAWGEADTMKEGVEVVVKRLRDYMQEHEANLKSRIIHPSPVRWHEPTVEIKETQHGS